MEEDDLPTWYIRNRDCWVRPGRYCFHYCIPGEWSELTSYKSVDRRWILDPQTRASWHQTDSVVWTKLYWQIANISSRS